MYTIDFSTPIHAHFIGIGGVSMSGLAVILKNRGFKISGSDSKLGPVTMKLEEQGIKVYEGNLAENLKITPDVVVVTAAVHADNPEYAEAVRKNIPILTRAELLGQIMKHYPTAIGVAGTHGKTTTTSMLTYILLGAEMDPTISVGGMLDKIGGNILVGGEDVFLTEACEYTNSFLSFFPTMEIILNVEADHLDFFKDINDIRYSFNKFMRLLPEDGQLIISSEIKDFRSLLGDVVCKNIKTFGSESSFSDYSYKDATVGCDGAYSFTVVAKNSPCDGMKVSLSVPGIHNVLNALAAIAGADMLEIKPDIIASALHEFHGTDRRFQKKGCLKGVTIVDDYAHHPQEIDATLSAAKNTSHKRTVVVFQPHTYSRTKLLFDDFAKALSAADEIILAKIYAARETDDLGVSSALLAAAIEKLGCKASAYDSFSEIEDYLLTHLQEGDLLITMGAGDVYKIGEDLLNGSDKN